MPATRLRQAYADCLKAGLTPDIVAAFMRALWDGQPSSAWSAGQTFTAAFFLELTALACEVSPTSAEQFAAFVPTLRQTPSHGAARWIHESLEAIQLLFPEQSAALRQALLEALT